MSRFVLLLALFWVAFAYSQPKEPQLPSVDFDPGYGVGFPVYIELFNKGRLSGYIIFESEPIITIKERNWQRSFGEIKVLKIIQWQRREAKRGYVFYPSKYEILFKDGSKFVLESNLSFFNKFQLKDSTGRQFVLYSFFYDYFKNGKWVNRGVSSFDENSDFPVTGCVVFLEVMQ
ncbi:MAG: hypothetical protein BWY23_01656 [Spirochaetes bacterium ADurb.Bin218]|mgnify:FL=1|jgi:hypothetical protein|nr:MAG: hypothetical protein BWY23_01656 [Spirochaetes bacterium ADurb.Bin218]HPX91814.1 hypothetical protein [Spirochaetota bacterium]